MTRKRFVKLLMADGYSRNEADSIAKDTVAEGCSYAEKHFSLWINRWFPFISALDMDHLANCFARVVEVILEELPSMVQAIIEAIPEVVEQTRIQIEELAERLHQQALTEVVNE